MEITYFGKTSIRIKGRNSALLVDPYQGNVSLAKQDADIVAITDPAKTDPSVIKTEFILASGAGEYEVKGINVVGFAEKLGEADLAHKVTGYIITIDNINIGHLGNFEQTKLDEAQLETLENVDILFIPVNSEGGLTTSSAAKLAAQIEPAIIIPLFSADASTLEENFLKEMGKGSIEHTKKLVITKDKLPEEPQIVILDES